MCFFQTCGEHPLVKNVYVFFLTQVCKCFYDSRLLCSFYLIIFRLYFQFNNRTRPNAHEQITQSFYWISKLIIYKCNQIVYIRIQNGTAIVANSMHLRVYNVYISHHHSEISLCNLFPFVQRLRKSLHYFKRRLPVSWEMLNVRSFAYIIYES